jgi:hypothetical protein
MNQIEIINHLPKNIADKIRNEYQIVPEIKINGAYGVIRNGIFFEQAFVKKIDGNDVHIIYTVETLGRDYTRNEIVPQDKTLFYKKMECSNGAGVVDASKERLKNFFKRNYIKKYNGK